MKHPPRSTRVGHRVRVVGGGRAHRAFTLIEMLVVASIIIIATTLLLPALGRIIDSANFAAAVNSVTATLGNARALAIQNGRATGVAFMFDAKRQVYSLQVLELDSLNGGSLTSDVAGVREHTYCLPVRPAANTVPIELPQGTAVYGLPAAPIRPELPNGDANPAWTIGIDRTTAHWFAGDVLELDATEVVGPTSIGEEIQEVPWIFPRNDPRLFTAGESDANIRPDDRIGGDPWAVITGAGTVPSLTLSDARQSVRHANSFCIIFTPDGTTTVSAGAGGQENYDFYIEWPNAPVRRSDTSAEPQPYDDPFIFDPETIEDWRTGAVVPIDERTPNPEVILRAVSQIAIVDVKRLTEDTAIRRPWLVRPGTRPGVRQAPKPNYLGVDRGDQTYFDDDKVRRVSSWIDTNAEIVGFNRYTGNAVRRKSSS